MSKKEHSIPVCICGNKSFALSIEYTGAHEGEIKVKHKDTQKDVFKKLQKVMNPNNFNIAYVYCTKCDTECDWESDLSKGRVQIWTEDEEETEDQIKDLEKRIALLQTQRTALKKKLED